MQSSVLEQHLSSKKKRNADEKPKISKKKRVENTGDGSVDVYKRQPYTLYSILFNYPNIRKCPMGESSRCHEDVNGRFGTPGCFYSFFLYFRTVWVYGCSNLPLHPVYSQNYLYFQNISLFGFSHPNFFSFSYSLTKNLLSSFRSTLVLVDSGSFILTVFSILQT